MFDGGWGVGGWQALSAFRYLALSGNPEGSWQPISISPREELCVFCAPSPPIRLLHPVLLADRRVTHPSNKVSSQTPSKGCLFRYILHCGGGEDSTDRLTSRPGEGNMGGGAWIPRLGNPELGLASDHPLSHLLAVKCDIRCACLYFGTAHAPMHVRFLQSKICISCNPKSQQWLCQGFLSIS